MKTIVTTIDNNSNNRFETHILLLVRPSKHHMEITINLHYKYTSNTHIGLHMTWEHNLIVYRYSDTHRWIFGAPSNNLFALIGIYMIFIILAEVCMCRFLANCILVGGLIEINAQHNIFTSHKIGINTSCE